MPGANGQGATYLVQATQMVATTELLLRARGYHPELVRRGISRAYGIAEFKARPLSAELKGRAFLEFLADEFSHVERWMDKQLDYFLEP